MAIIFRTITTEEINDLVFGTGSLSWEWWRDADVHENGSVTLTAENPEEGPETITKTITKSAIKKAAEKALTDGQVSTEDAEEVKTESLGYLDANAGDIVLQLAFFGEIIYG